MLPKATFLKQPIAFEQDLKAMLAELSVDNHDAYREVLRMDPLPGRDKPRLTYARNFFGSLEDVARYWDNSLDQYYHRPGNEPGTDRLASREITSGNQRDRKLVPDAAKDRSTVGHETDKDGGLGQQSQTTEVYKGYRLGNGEQMNPGTRVAMVKNFLKMVTHKFMCRDHEPMPAPREKLIVRGVKIQSVQYQFCIARIPSDTKLARARFVEGPIMATHCREEIRFDQTPAIASAASLLTGAGADHRNSKTEQSSTVRETPLTPFVGQKFDLFREIGCLLILAQQRDREGRKKEAYSGSDKWWTTQKRFGGGKMAWGQLASEGYEDEDPSWSPAEKILQEQKRQKEQDLRMNGTAGMALVSATDVDAIMASNAPVLTSKPGDPLTNSPKKKKLRSLDRPPGKEEEIRDGRRLMYVPPFKKRWYQEWQKLRPNTPTWDDKIVYKHIGKGKDTEFDELYMLSSVNHHLALVKMKVHPEYLEWLESGHKVIAEEVDGFRRDVVYVERGKWFDMFDVQARKELLSALWQLFSWLNRDFIDSGSGNTSAKLEGNG